MTDPSGALISLHRPDQDEELARAELYGLLAQLWLASPAQALLERLQSASENNGEASAGFLTGAWRDLVRALRESTVVGAAQEHDALFGGIGKPEVFLYGSYYLSGFLNEKPLAALRTDLLALGLARDPQRLETEDHIAYGFEVMRYLIAGDDGAVCNLEQQRKFFRTHLQPWVETLCATVQAHPRAIVWQALAALTAQFMKVETQAFDMLEL